MGNTARPDLRLQQPGLARLGRQRSRFAVAHTLTAEGALTLSKIDPRKAAIAIDQNAGRASLHAGIAAGAAIKKRGLIQRPRRTLCGLDPAHAPTQEAPTRERSRFQETSPR
ncbi:hypothetical protein SDC9_145798 [bioreactor metagenome]|uniref:Uncharacterized protein n=1 Tax=bioreactor metagenome TaxID=1076179 RepID=A0A645E9Y6_9ZZZZ